MVHRYNADPNVLNFTTNAFGTDYRNVYHAFFTIQIGGMSLQDYHLDIRQVRLRDTSSGANTLTIVIDDPEFVLINASIFEEETPVSFEGGIVQGDTQKFDGYINIVDVDFPDTGVPRLTIHCMDKSHKLNRKKETKTWKKMSYSDIATAIFKKHGLKAIVDSTGKKEDTVSQSNKSDMEFLIELAGKTDVPYLVDVSGSEGKFVKKNFSGASTHELQYRQFPYDIVSFSPRLNKSVKQEEVSKGSISTKDKKSNKASRKEDTQRDKSASKSTNDSSSGSSGSGGAPDKVYKYNGRGKGWSVK